MNNQDFTLTLLVKQTPAEAYAAINNVRGWWSTTLEGDSEQLNDVFIYRYKDLHYTKHQLIEVVPNEKVVWLVLDSHLSFVVQKEEWNGTTISFEIAPKGDETEIRFVHHGLVPQFECYGACSKGWTHYITNSLQKLIVTGKGQPN